MNLFPIVSRWSIGRLTPSKKITDDISEVSDSSLSRVTPAETIQMLSILPKPLGCFECSGDYGDAFTTAETIRML